SDDFSGHVGIGHHGGDHAGIARHKGAHGVEHMNRVTCAGANPIHCLLVGGIGMAHSHHNSHACCVRDQLQAACDLGSHGEHANEPVSRFDELSQDLNRGLCDRFDGMNATACFADEWSLEVNAENIGAEAAVLFRVFV